MRLKTRIFRAPMHGPRGRTLSMNLKFTRDPAALLKHFLADIQQKRAATEAHRQRRY